jgi:hypothetical protein
MTFVNGAVTGMDEIAVVPAFAGTTIRESENYIMSSLHLTAPAVEPLSLDKARAYLCVETTADDELIGALIAGARIPPVGRGFAADVILSV